MGIPMNQQPTYLPLIQSLLNSPRDEQIAILQNNLELIDDNFARYLREWATQTLAEMESEEATNIIPIFSFSNLIKRLRKWTSRTFAAIKSYRFANKLYSFNITISSFPLGSRAANIEIAIACLEVGLIIFTREAYPKDWGYNQNSLGIKYGDRIREDKAENIEKAIACYELALLVYTRAAFPQDWAMTQNNLAIAYSDRIKEDKAENLEKAIACYDLALLVRTRADFPQDWADTQNNLAIAYSDRIREDKAQNIEKAIACYELALLVHTRAAFPQYWADTQNNLAIAYQEKGLIPEAIKCFKSSLEIFTPDALPLSCLQTARNLGNLGFAESLWETAIFGYEKAIEAVEQSREWIASENRKREIIEDNLNVYEKMIQSCINHQQYHKAIQTI